MESNCRQRSFYIDPLYRSFIAILTLVPSTLLHRWAPSSPGNTNTGSRSPICSFPLHNRVLILFNRLQRVPPHWRSMQPVSFLVIERGYDVKKRNTLLLLLLVATAFALVQLPFFKPESNLESTSNFQQIPLTFQSAPDFTLPGLHGAQVTLGDFRGSIVLLEFWASW